MRNGLAALGLLLSGCGGGTDPLPTPCAGNSCSVESCGFGSGSSAPQEVLRFGKDDVEVLIHREDVGQGAGHSSIYELRGFALLHENQVQCMSASLRYENSHHNWFDHAFAMGAGQIEYEMLVKFQPEGDPVTSDWVWTYTLTGRKNGAIVVEPKLLDLKSGRP